MVKIEQTTHFTVNSWLVTTVCVVIGIILCIFFSAQIQRFFASRLKKLGTRLGMYSADSEYKVQRYVYQHSTSIPARYYNFINRQLIATGLKRSGVTVVGYTLFWGILSAIISIVLTLMMGLNIGMLLALWVVTFIIFIIVSRATVAARLQSREEDVMNAEDTIIPTITDGVQNSIIMHIDNYKPSVRDAFKAFKSNIQDRGISFEAAMIMLADELGPVFRNFANKAIYFERIGDPSMRDIFEDVVETNRLRRQLRDENRQAFLNLKRDFTLSTIICSGYFIFCMVTDTFSRQIYLQTWWGNGLLIMFIVIIFGVYSYIATIQSRDL